ncbi:hypothetical protein QBC37DRAFT_384859 [Rhypophila decipiens]|uniref:Uncharacterized protein n=1 Tax=Rhypophila decipiens TaxID=261697 RepID=A0AAN6YE44_9PEZI|nr:hypothetical protein QBC37DRAFT_384859 [Rhypophila decipiens]
MTAKPGSRFPKPAWLNRRLSPDAAGGRRWKKGEEDQDKKKETVEKKEGPTPLRGGGATDSSPESMRSSHSSQGVQHLCYGQKRSTRKNVT